MTFTGFTRVQYKQPLHKTLLAEVYRWAMARSEAYLDETGYTTRESFFEPPPHSVEFFVMVEGKPSALLTFIRWGKGVFQVGLITDPGARLRPLLAALRDVRAWLPGCGASELWVKLPLRSCYDAARKLAAKLGFNQINETDWKLELTHGNTK